MMGIATITLTDRDGHIDLLATYDGEGFSVDSPAHQHAQELIGLMDQIAKPVGERLNLSAADILKFTAAAQNNVALTEAPTAG